MEKKKREKMKEIFLKIVQMATIFVSVLILKYAMTEPTGLKIVKAKRKDSEIHRVYNKYKSFFVKKSKFEHVKHFAFCLTVAFLSVFSFVFFFALGKEVSVSSNTEISEVLPLLTVFGAAIVSLLVAEQAKQNETNKHREKWCSELRGHFSDFSAAVNSYSRGYEKGVVGVAGSPMDRLERLVKNIKSSHEEIKEIDRMHHVLSLYLVSGKNGAPENTVFSVTENMISNIHKKSDDIVNFFNKWYGISLGAPYMLEEANRKFDSLQIMTHDKLKSVNYLVKIYLDGEWEKIKNNKYSNKKKTIFLYLLLVNIFIFFLGFLEINISFNDMLQVLKGLVKTS